MFQFPGFASNPYEFRARYLHLTIRSPNPRIAAHGLPATPPEGNGFRLRIVEGGFPHSEISGSKSVRNSPELIAAYHVLHRLSAPRHPPNALKALDRSHDRCPLPEPQVEDDSCKRSVWETVHNQKDHFMLLMRPYFHAGLAAHTLLAGSSQPLQDASTLHDVKQHADGVNSNICETVIRMNKNT